MNARNNKVHVNYYQRKQQNTGCKWKPTNIKVKKSDFLPGDDMVKKERRFFLNVNKKKTVKIKI